MKRWICGLICLMMVFAFADSLAAITYTLPEKMVKQLDIGSGLKGNLTIHAEGNDPVILSLQPFQDVELQLRSLKSGEETHGYLYQAGAEEQQIGLTELYQTPEKSFFRSDLLPGEVFSFPETAQLLDLLQKPAGGNPAFLSALYRWMRIPAEEQKALLDPLTEKLSGALEIWIAQFAAVSEVRTLENGTSALDLTYSIPMKELKQEMVLLLKQMTASAEGQALLDRILTEEQKAVFANANLDYFYSAALNALENDYDLTFTRTVSTLGTTLSSIMELPLDENRLKYQSLVIEEHDGLTSYTLRNEEQLLTVMMGSGINWNEISSFSAWIILRPNPDTGKDAKAEYHAWRVDLGHRTEVSSDEESRDHQRDEWKLLVERDVSRLPEGENPALYPEEVPVNLEVNLHFFSKYSQSSPTTLEFDARLTKDQFDLSVKGQVKTASPWFFAPFDTQNAKDLTQMTEEQLNVKLAELLASASEQLIPVQESTEPAEAAEKTTAEAEAAQAADAGEPAEAEAAQAADAGEPAEQKAAQTSDAGEAAEVETAQATDAGEPAETEEAPAPEEGEPAEEAAAENADGQ